MADYQLGDDKGNVLYGTDGVVDIIWGLDGKDDIYGRGGDDVLYGDEGADFLYGEDGRDTLEGGEDRDILYGGAGNDMLRGGVDLDRLEGGDGDDVLDGGTAYDFMYGQAGNDTYLVDHAEDLVSEEDGDGIDTVIASISCTLPGSEKGSVENLTLAAGSAPLNGTGNDLGNVLTGNAGNNVLVGYGGWDTLIGGGGQDTLNGGTGADTLSGGAEADTLTGGRGQDRFEFDAALDKRLDTITDFAAADDMIWLDDAVFTALGPKGPLDPSAFYIGSTARDPDHRIIYDPATGFLTYDANGSAPGGAVPFAILDPGLALTSADVWVF